jgi:predicted chitinase
MATQHERLFERPQLGTTAAHTCDCASCRQADVEGDAEFGQWLRKTLRAASVAVGMGLATIPSPQAQKVAQSVATAVTGRTRDSDERERRTRPQAKRDLRGAAPPDREYAPSVTRAAFEQATQAGDWRSAFLNLNGLSMYEMLRALDQMPPDALSRLWASRASFTGMVHMPRIAYARWVVLVRTLPPPIGDLAATSQVQDAADFIAETLLPIARRVNRAALPHLSLILQACRNQGITDKSHIAYVLASAHHESKMGGNMVEGASGMAYEGRSDLGNNSPGDGPRYKGRGYVQLTGRRNYTRYSHLLGVDFVRHPQRVTEPMNAAFILTHGMRAGIFTGRRLANFGADGSYDFVNARRIINKLDRAESIAAIARRYRAALR